MKSAYLALVLVALAASASAQSSPDNSRVPPLASVKDAAGAVWSMVNGTGERMILKNGADSNGGGSEILIWKGICYVLGGDNQYWQYTGTTWTPVGPDPSPGPIVPPVIVTGSSRIGWVQPNRSVVQAKAGVTTIYTDGAARPVANIVCLAVNGQTECDAPLPALTPGKHALTLTFRTVVGGVESVKSNTLNVTTSTSLTPTGVGLKP